MPRDAAPSVKNVNSLTLAFAKAVAANQEDKTDNLVVSPYNALTALSMVAKGADSNTKAELARTLFGVEAKDLDQAVTDLAALNHAILESNKDQVELKTANGVWTNKELLDLDHNFAGELKKIFGAEINAEQFTDPAVVKKINEWAANNTNDLIKEIVKELKPDDFAVLASALYFKGDWTNAFDKKHTENRAFTTDGGDVSLTPTMKKNFDEGHVRYHKGADYDAIALTYGEKDWNKNKHPSMRMILIRPKDDAVHARDWLAQQAGGKDEPAWLEPYSFKGVSGNVELPRIDIKQTHDLIPALQEIGIRDAFNPDNADFAPMTAQKSKDISVNKVSHDVVFKTDEKGSEAAAVTTIGMIRATSIRMPEPPIDIKFDRSFVFALQDVKTGAVIFTGAVNKPNDEMNPAPKAKGPKPA